MLACLSLLRRSNNGGKAPARVETSIQHHRGDNTHHMRNSIRLGIEQMWNDNSPPQDSIKNGKSSLEIVTLGNDLVHPTWNGNIDVTQLSSSVQQYLSTLVVVVVDGLSQSRASIIIHKFKLSAGGKEL